MVDQSQPILSKFKLGSLELPNRIVLAALTRTRADPKTGVPSDLMVEYYSSRASAALLLTESAPIAAEANAYPGAGCIYTDE